MAITKKDVQHIAKLARIELAPDEETKFENDLSAVLEFVNTLNKVNTEDTKPLTGGIDAVNIMRKDDAIETLSAREQKLERAARLVTAAPEHKNGFVKVKSIFE